LTTSRIRLNLYEEWHFELTGLALPLEQETANLANHTALQLFVQRARQVGRIDFDESQLAIIAQICYFLAGLPLGIELAAGWLRSHTLSQIAAEIEQNLAFLSTNIKNVPQRHRSLQVAFDHSWRLLPTQSQPTLARLTVFRDGFDQKAAEFVSDATQTTLLNLVDHSILHLSDGRFQIHELIRQFSAEKLSSDDNAETRKRHANYFATFLESQEPCRWTATEPAALDEISLELKNIQAGWHWAVSQSQNPPQSNLASTLIARFATMLAYF
jgi:predicted ATPase